MHTRSSSMLPLLAPVSFVGALLLSSCSLQTLGVKQKGGLERVDELLSYVEGVQVEADRKSVV